MRENNSKSKTQLIIEQLTELNKLIQREQLDKVNATLDRRDHLKPVVGQHMIFNGYGVRGVTYDEHLASIIVKSIRSVPTLLTLCTELSAELEWYKAICEELRVTDRYRAELSLSEKGVKRPETVKPIFE